MEKLRKLMNNKLLMTIIGIVIMIIYLSPIYWMFISGIKTETEVYANPPTLWPKNVIINPIKQVFEQNGLRYLGNSILIATSSTILTLIIGTLGGYAMARLKLKWLNLVLFVFLVSQMLPQVLRTTPLFVIFRQMGLINNYLSVIIANSTLTIPFAVIMLRTTFLQVPVALEEASWIDGCNKFESLFYITFPVAKTGLLVVAVMSFVWGYGDFIFAVSFLSDQSMQPATVGLYNFIGSQATRWNNVMAFASLTAMPLIVLFLYFQKHFVKGLSAGSIK